MINPAAITAFLSRKLANSGRAKKLSSAELDAALAELDPPPSFHIPPYDHQKVSFLLCVKYPGYCCWLEQGLGKTKLTLDLAAYFAASDGYRTLVLVPYGSQVPEWAEREAPKHRPGLSVRAVDGSPSERADIFWNSSAGVVVTTYAGFLNFVCGRAEGKMSPKLELLRKLVERYQVIFADESSVLGDHKSLIVRTLRKLRELGLERLYQLTGTPFGNDPHRLWSQLYLADGGATLGSTLGIFRAAFFTTKRNFWGGFDYTFDKRKTELLHRMLANRSIRYTSDEVEDLPPISGGITSGGDLLVRMTKLHEGTVEYYKAVLEELKAAKGNYTETENAWHRMRRISSGYLLPKDDAGEEHPLVFPINPKLDLLLELLEEASLDKQIIVFCVYRYTAKLLTEALRGKKYKVATLIGGSNTKEVSEFIAGRKRILVANEAAGFGLNLQCASITVFFESPVAPISRRQLEKRTHRGDQKSHVFIYDLCVKGTADGKILKALKDGADLFQNVLAGRIDSLE